MEKTFDIIAAVRNAYGFVFREWVYLLKIAILPALLHAGTAVYVQSQHPDATVLRGFLLGFPASVLFAWFLVLEARLLVMGERVAQLPDDAEFLAVRRRQVQAGILVSLLFNMGFTAIAAFLEWSASAGHFGTNAAITGFTLFLIGGMFWALRLGMAPFLAATGQPIRDFVVRVDGMMFSLRMLGMGILCVLPVFFVFQLVLSLVVPDPANMTQQQFYLLVAFGTPVSVILLALLNAACGYALLDMMSGGKKRGSRP